MTTSFKLVAGDAFPTIKANLLDGSTVQLGQTITEGAAWHMVVVYRGKHCPLCTRYLNLLEEYKTKLADIGVDVMAVSADSKDQLEEHIQKLNVSFPIAYGLTEVQMKQLGLYVSMPRHEQETDHNFAEPGMFIINEAGTLQSVDISNAPSLRPELEIVVHGLTFVRSQETYPIRGTVEY